jgi:peptidase E
MAEFKAAYAYYDMAKLYFLGGENVAKRDATEINSLAFEDAGGSPAVVVFPWARPSFDASYRRRERVTAYFRSLGASSVEFADYSDPQGDIAAQVACCDLIYLTGGQLSTLITRLQSRGVDALLRSFEGVVVGRSAGALALGRKCLVTNRYSKACRVVDGLGLVDFSVKVHYLPSQDPLLNRFSKKEKIYGIPQRAAVTYHEGAVAFLGEVCCFENGEKLFY